MIQIRIDTENGNRVSFSEKQNGSILGAVMSFDLSEVKDVTIEDVLKFKVAQDVLVEAPFGERAITELLFALTEERRKEEFNKKFLSIFSKVLKLK